MRQILGISFILILIACSSEKSKDNPKLPDSTSTVAAVQVSATDDCDKCVLELTPNTASRGTVLLLKAQGFYLSNSKIEWMVNENSVINSEPYQFKTEGVKKGDTVQASAIVQEKKILSNIVRIKNALPIVDGVVKIRYEGNKISVEAAGSDADKDTVTFFYEWTKNGVPAGTGKKIEVPLKRGDNFTVKITPFDGEDYGREMFIKKEVQNSPPFIMSIDRKDYTYERKKLVYKIKAADPDDDTLTYKLKTAPQGMTIDQLTGIVEWEAPFNHEGKISFEISVSDGHGGEATQQVTLNIEEF